MNALNTVRNTKADYVSRRGLWYKIVRKPENLQKVLLRLSHRVFMRGVVADMGSHLLWIKPKS